LSSNIRYFGSSSGRGAAAATSAAGKRATLTAGIAAQAEAVKPKRTRIGLRRLNLRHQTVEETLPQSAAKAARSTIIASKVIRADWLF